MRHELPNLPTLPPGEGERIRRSREALVGGGLLSAPPGDTGVPSYIEMSWRRCVGERVPVTRSEIEYREPEDAQSVLGRAAGPVLERLKDSFADVPVAMVVSDATGRIVMRHADLGRQRTIMDRARAAEGFDFSEGSVGTNGIGTVLVERKPVLVRGPEHYNELLEDLTCAGIPIFEPYTGRLIGTFSLACVVGDVNPLMPVLAGDIGRQIEARILEEAGDRQRRLAQAYLSMDRAKGAALVVDEDTVLANRLGLRHTGPELHATLWPFLAEHGPTRAEKMPVPLSDGLHEALVEPIHDGDRRAYSVRFSTRRSGGAVPESRATARAVPPAAREPLHFHPDVHRQLETVVRHQERVALTGASGTGKLRTALRTLRRQGADDPVVLEPQLDPDWFDAATKAATEGRGLVVRRIHATPPPTVAQMEALTSSGVPVAVTVDLDAAGDTVVGLVRQVATTVRLPTLTQSREHLPALVRAMLAELPAPRSRTRIAPVAWDRLTAWHWPGNLAELRNTVHLLARRADGATVDEDDLPDELRVAHRASGLMESAERKAVAEALRAAGGNRSRAAAALGIGRNTLYRKMREFGIT
jgi:transcriptional regulator of acetoin/glycerol metabolism